jgi:hypothetical protein
MPSLHIQYENNGHFMMNQHPSPGSVYGDQPQVGMSMPNIGSPVESQGTSGFDDRWQ